jgi:hypothetical protein
MPEEAEMALDATLAGQDALDKVPEGFRSLYRKLEDGSFALDVNPVGGVRLENVDDLKRALQAERAQHKKIAAEHKALAEQFDGLDAEAARDALKRIEEIGEGEGEEAIQQKIDAKVAEIQAKYQRDTEKARADFKAKEDKLADEVGDYRGRFYRQMVDTESTAAIAALGGNPKLLGSYVRSQLMIVDHDGVASVQVRGPDGNALLTEKPNSTDPMSVAEYVAKLREDKDFAPAFAGSNASGAGAGRTGRGSVPGAPMEVNLSDPQAVSDNLEGIAKGTVIARSPERR